MKKSKFAHRVGKKRKKRGILDELECGWGMGRGEKTEAKVERRNR